MIWPTLRSLLFRLDAERVHGAAASVLRVVPTWMARRLWPRPSPLLRIRCLGLELASPLGLAAGFDKGEVLLPGLFALGFASVEVGTVTPRPQPGNERPRLFRLPEHRALLNRMGFNNAGMLACAARLSALKEGARLGVVGVDVGRNKATDNEEALSDYLACIDGLHPFADYLVVNISSPNTPGLRKLQEEASLSRLLCACAARVRERAPGKPLFVKLSPDLSDEALDSGGGRRRAGGGFGGDRHQHDDLESRRRRRSEGQRARRPVRGAPRAPGHRGGAPLLRKVRGEAPGRRVRGRHERRGCLRQDPSRRLAGTGLHGVHLRGSPLRAPAEPWAGGAPLARWV